MTQIGPAEAAYRAKHWWTHRGPRDEAERDQLLGLSFEPSVHSEGLLVVRERHPNLFALLPSDAQAALETYARQRAAAVRHGLPSVERIPTIDVEPIDRAAAAVEAARPAYDIDGDVANRYDEHKHRRALVEAVQGRRWVEAFDAFAAWIDAWGADRQLQQGLVDARLLLGQSASMNGSPRPRFLGELEVAMDGLQPRGM